jgi:hypothetical protein
MQLILSNYNMKKFPKNKETKYQPSTDAERAEFKQLLTEVENKMREEHAIYIATLTPEEIEERDKMIEEDASRFCDDF